MAMMMMATCSLPFSSCFPELRSSSLKTSRIGCTDDFTAQWHHLSPLRTFCGGEMSTQRSGSRRRGNIRVTWEENQCSQQDVEESQRWPESGRREVLSAMAMVAVVGILRGDDDARADEETEVVDVPSLEPYIDEKEGFKLLRPVLWNKVGTAQNVMGSRIVKVAMKHKVIEVEKAGATVLFEDPVKRGNTIGVVVNPVRISSLKDFGTPDDIANKLIAAERRKPSTNDTQLVRVMERQAQGNTPLYALEYTLDSSRGKKRILSAVTVASRKLYILNIAYTDSPATPAPLAIAEVFQQVLNSFDLVN